MKIKKILLLTLIIASNLLAKSQIFLEQHFETGAKPSTWTEEYTSGTEPWRYRNGGHNPNDNNWTTPASEIDIARNPPSAHGGTYNAIFFKQSNANERTRLVTPLMNLSGAIKPELTFWLCQVPWTFSGSTSWDVLRVYYKTSVSGSWVLLAEYLDPVEEWTECKINLPNASSTYFVAFEAQTRWGFGCCIDDVVIEEKGTEKKWVSDLKVSQPDLNFVPTGSNNVPIMRIDVKIYGNTGTAIFDSLAVTSLNTSDNDIKPNGVKLFQTTSTSFNSSNQIGASTNFVSGKAIFQNINYSLPSGQSYVWVTYDVRDTAKHGDLIDCKILANSMLINDTLYPATTKSPAGSRVIYETIYHETFEGTHGWTLSGEFEVAAPQGLGGSTGNADPSYAYSGTKILGTDITGKGTYPGDYEPDLTTATAYTATSPGINVFYFKNLSLSFRRYLNLDIWDNASILASTDNGVTWDTIWYEQSIYTDFEWNYENYSIPSSLARHANLKFRFTLGPTDASENYSGWNIDDVVLTGDYIEKDAAIVEWVYPKSGCGHSATDSVVVKIANLGAKAIPANMPVKYSFNGGTTWVTNYVTKSIPVGDTIEYVFTTKVNLSQPGLRSSVLAKTALSGDEETSNDQISTQVYVVPTYTPPFTATFEGSNGYWRPFGTSLWEYGTPAKSIINSTSSGVGSWVTDLTENYGNALSPDSSVLISDDFEADNGWTYSGEFQRATLENLPSGLIPYNTYSGFYIIGTDLTGTGAYAGKYEKNISEASAYSATSPALNVSGHVSIGVHFQRWLNIMADDNVKFQASDDNGATWATIWENSGTAISDSYWTPEYYRIPDSLSSTTQLRLRFILYSNSDNNVAEGINIDDFIVYGKTFISSPAYLQSPCFNLTGSTLPVVDMKIFSQTEANVDGATLYYSTDEGSTWNHVSNSDSHDTYWNWYTGSSVSALGTDGWSGESTAWKRARHLLSTAIAGHNGVVFRYAFGADKMNNNYNGVALDDIKLYEAPFDIGVQSILSPATTCQLGEKQPISVRIKNYGIRDMEIGDTLIVGVNVSYNGIYGGESASALETKILTSKLAVGNTLDYTFTKTFDMSITGDYNVDAFTKIEDEPLFYSASANDTATTTITVEQPYIELGSDIYTVRPDTVKLVATNVNTDITYNWYNNRSLTSSISNNDTYTVPTIAGGQFFVTLTNSTPCTSVDSITVHRLIADVGITSFDSPATSNCELSNKTPFRVCIKNFGSDTLTAGDTLYLGYKFGLEAVVDTNWVMTQNLLPNDSLVFTFKESLNMSTIAAYELKAWASVYYDNDATNDTLLQTINVWGYPSYTLTVPGEVNDTIDVVDFKYKVDAGSVWSAYSWKNYPDSTKSTLNTYKTEWVIPTVYDIHKCPDTDSVFVNLQFTSIGVDTVLTPVSSCAYSSPVIPQFRIKNLGSVTIPSGKDINYGYTLNGTTMQTGTYTLTGDLKPNEYIEPPLTVASDITSVGDYTFTFYVNMTGDPKAEDDVLVHPVSVYGYPVLDLGDDVFTRNLSYTLDAGAGRDSYLWSTGEKTRTITVDTTNNYSVDIVEDGICSANDNINVTFLKHDYSITQLFQPVTGCSSADPQTVSVRFSNVGNDTLGIGSVVKFGYKVNGGVAVEQNYTLTSKLTPASYIDFSFTQKIDVSAVGDYNLDLYGVYTGDFDTSNDTLSTTITTYDVPVVDLGEDRTIRTGQTTLDAGTGAGYTYKWQDNSTNQYFIVSTTGDYNVTVTNSHGCQDRDTVHITSLTPDYSVTAISSPSTSCMLSSEESVTIIVKNNGTDTLYASAQIPVQLSVNSTVVANENITLLESFNPGDEIEYTFSQTVNMSTAGSYVINASTEHSMDLNPTNDLFSKSINVWGLPTVTHPSVGALCVNGTPITLSGGSPTGGTYSGTGITGTTFDPSVAGSGLKTITYRYVDGNGCSNFKNIVITVYSLPTVTLSAFSALCANADSIALSGGSPTGGTYSVNSKTSTYFDPKKYGAGTHTISYSYTNTNGCTNTASRSITVNSLPAITLTVPSSLCIDGPLTPLTGGSPAGGTYSGDGVSGTNFYPASAGVGEHTITYTYTNTSTSCTNTATAIITVYSLPVVSLGADRSFCQGSSVTLDAGNAGSTFLWNTAETSQTISVSDEGTYSVTVTSTHGCQSSDAIVLTQNPLPTVTLASFEPVCLNSDPFTLSGGSPDLGTYSGTGVNSGIFYPSIATAGDHTITYTYIDGNGCSNSANQTLTVRSLPAVTFAAPSPVCENAEAFELAGGLPTGGNYAGTGVNAGYFQPQVTGDGTFTLLYYYTDTNNCTDTATADITVKALPVASISTTGKTAYCTGDVISTALTAIPSGAEAYQWYKNGSIISTATSDTYTATEVGDYTVTVTVNGCSGTSSATTISVNTLPVVTFSPLSDVCLDATPFTLTGGSPANGTYSGTGVSSNTFSPSTAGAGTHTITYTYTDGNECTNTATSNIKVNALPVVKDLGENRSITEETTLDAGDGFSSYLWNTGETTQTIKVSSTGTYSVTVTDANGCHGYDEVYLLWQETIDVAVSELISPSTNDCHDPNGQTIIAKLKNNGTKTFNSGEQINVSYQVGTNSPVVETMTFTSSLANGQTVNYSFNQKASIDVGTVTLFLKTIVSGIEGGTTSFQSTINATPTVVLCAGADTVRTNLPYTIVPSVTGNVTYNWSTTNTHSTITVSSYGTYWLTVTDTTNHANCTASDTVAILSVDDVEIIPGTNAKVTLFPNPVSEELNITIETDKNEAFAIDFISPLGQIIRNLKTDKTTYFNDKINVNGYAPGAYYIKVSSSKGSAVFKVIVQR